METLPTELLSLIFSLACTDGGSTGVSLSATSQRIRALSRPYSLQTISLYSWTQVAAFSALLKTRRREAAQTPPYLPFRGHHLYMTGRRSACPSRVCSLDCSRDNLYSRYTQVAPGTSTHVEHAYDILTLLGPQLRTLVILLFDEPHASSGIDIALTLPKLEELTVHSSFLHTSNHTAPRNLRIPTLRRLHIVQNFAFDCEFVKQVSELAPALTHLRISELSTVMYHSGDLIHRGVASLVRAGGTEGDNPDTFPSTLDRLVLQFRTEDCDVSLAQVPASPLCAYRAAYFEAQLQSMLSTLSRYIRDDSERRVIVLRPYARDGSKSCPPTPSPQHRYADIERGWKARASGEEGLWEVNDSEILLAYGHRGPLDLREKRIVS